MLIEGKEVAKSIYNDIQKEMSQYNNPKPGLAFILVGNDLASLTYVKMKRKRCQQLGFHSEIVHLPEDISSDKLKETIEQFNQDSSIHGILVQQPLPKQINPTKMIEVISPEKDVDGFHPINMGKLLLEDETGFIPCTPFGIIKMLKFYHIDLTGKHVVVIGRSSIVGKPLATLLAQKKPFLNATVTLCHSRTKDIASFAKTADVVIAAIGSPSFIKENMIKEGAIVIDVGINRLNDLEKAKIVGDVDFANVKEKTSYITPVPGGVGPMTIAMLLHNTWISYKKTL